MRFLRGGLALSVIAAVLLTAGTLPARADDAHPLLDRAFGDASQRAKILAGAAYIATHAVLTDAPVGDETSQLTETWLFRWTPE